MKLLVLIAVLFSFTGSFAQTGDEICQANSRKSIEAFNIYDYLYTKAVPWDPEIYPEEKQAEPGATYCAMYWLYSGCDGGMCGDAIVATHVKVSADGTLTEGGFESGTLAN